MPNASRQIVAFAVCVLALLPAAGKAAWELIGTKSVFATTADGQRIKLGQVEFTPTSVGSATFQLKLEAAPFEDHFLSMREFKCVSGIKELTCHVPYPYANPRSVRIENLAWLEHSLLFFYKLPADFGAKLWNGIYFELKPTESGLVGRPRAIDLNLIAAPPADPSKPPYLPSRRDDMPAASRWIQSLIIE